MYNRINESEFEVKTSEFSTRQVVSTPWGKAFKASSSLSCRAISFHEPRRTLDRLSSDTRDKHVKSCFRVVSIPWIHVSFIIEQSITFLTMCSLFWRTRCYETHRFNQIPLKLRVSQLFNREMSKFFRRFLKIIDNF